MTLCDAERRLLANALLDLGNERFVLISESTIPIHNFTTVYSYLVGSQHSFVESYDDPGTEGRGRYSENMVPEVTLEQWRKGAQWFEVHRDVALMMVEDVVYYPKFKKFCVPNCFSDEHYFPTMLTNIAPQLLGNRSLTWLDWSRGGAHPAMFGLEDLSEDFFRRIDEGITCTYNGEEISSCYLFARKFAPGGLERLIELLGPRLGFQQA